MNYIYKITNNINGKVYIGKTIYPIEHRWKEHISAATSNNKRKDYNFLLHKAIRKYGIENFTVEEIEKILEESKLAERESYWINYYNSCILEEKSNGYNMTYGGEGSSKINKKQIEELWLQGEGSVSISKQTGYHISSIKKILKTFSSYSKEIDLARNTGRKVYQYNEKGRLIKSYPSISYAAKQVHVDPSLINKCCNGHAQSCAGSFWSFSNDEEFEPKKLTRWHILPVNQFSLDGKLIQQHKSLSAAARSMNKKQSRYIKECCEKKRENMYGYIWEYAEVYRG